MQCARPVGRRTVRGAGSADGFTLVEVLVAAALVAAVLIPITAFLVRAVRTTDAQGALQEATRLAADGLDSIRAMPAAALVRGRDAGSVAAQWATAPAAVRESLAGMTPASDPAAAAGAGAGAAVPTIPVPYAGRTGPAFTRTYYVGRCWQASADSGCAAPAVGNPFLRVVLAVTWTGRDCPADGCVYRAAAVRTAAATDPYFPPVALLRTGAAPVAA
ncbi:hypothetical protein GCM10010123_37210 [Pilimelia anulata]|uniref:Prepilin-type N-terminal cleavage/methylation domain-containing protein n=1 Tax=Pilimelia anulata TaxID=53371 RepID=A0A8J3BBZ9_9ACTN|nr:prepilin-type N-terminal cleavage/methylation domain-containing protein [Pilimelia anulata]GGK03823.1 hypothetical protein GCM10010123_37210 [Pilimelia anulata]